VSLKTSFLEPMTGRYRPQQYTIDLSANADVAGLPWNPQAKKQAEAQFGGINFVPRSLQGQGSRKPAVKQTRGCKIAIYY